jgi:hypothetical protein
MNMRPEANVLNYVKWDESLSNKWLYKIYKGYHMKPINAKRNLEGKDSILYNGCYKERQEGRWLQK